SGRLATFGKRRTHRLSPSSTPIRAMVSGSWGRRTQDPTQRQRAARESEIRRLFFKSRLGQVASDALQSADERRTLRLIERGQGPLAELIHLAPYRLLHVPPPLRQEQPHKAPVPLVWPPAEQARCLHPGRRPSHRRRRQAEAPGDLAWREPVLRPEALKDKLLPVVDPVAREGGRRGLRQDALGRPEDGLEIRDGFLRHSLALGISLQSLAG